MLKRAPNELVQLFNMNQVVQNSLPTRGKDKLFINQFYTEFGKRSLKHKVLTLKLSFLSREVNCSTFPVQDAYTVVVILKEASFIWSFV